MDTRVWPLLQPKYLAIYRNPTEPVVHQHRRKASKAPRTHPHTRRERPSSEASQTPNRACFAPTAPHHPFLTSCERCRDWRGSSRACRQRGPRPPATAADLLARSRPLFVCAACKSLFVDLLGSERHGFSDRDRPRHYFQEKKLSFHALPPAMPTAAADRRRRCRDQPPLPACPPLLPVCSCVGVWQHDRVEIIPNEQVGAGGPARC